MHLDEGGGKRAYHYYFDGDGPEASKKKGDNKEHRSRVTNKVGIPLLLFSPIRPTEIDAKGGNPSLSSQEEEKEKRYFLYDSRFFGGRRQFSPPFLDAMPHRCIFNRHNPIWHKINLYSLICKVIEISSHTSE